MRPSEVIVVVAVAPKYALLKTANGEEVAAASCELTVRKVKSLPPPAPVASVPQ